MTEVETAIIDLLMPLIDQKVQQEIDKRIDEIEKKQDEDRPMTAREAYEWITRTEGNGDSAVSQYMNNLVRTKQIHKIAGTKRPLFYKSEVKRYLDERVVTGRVV